MTQMNPSMKQNIDNILAVAEGKGVRGGMEWEVGVS